MEKRLIATMVAAAFAGTAGVAVAGPISVASIGTYAAETIGAATGAITLGNVAYTLSSPFAASSTQTVKYGLSGQKINTCPAAELQPGVIGAAVSPPTKAADSLSCAYTVTVAATAVPAGTIVSFTNASADKTAGAVLAAGSPLTATVGVFDSANNLVESNSASVAVAAQAMSAKWTSSAAFGKAPANETSKVNVATAAPGTSFTLDADVTPVTDRIALGSFSLVQNAGTYLDSDGVTPVTIGTLTTNVWALTVTGPFSSDSKGVGNVWISDNANCATAPLAAMTVTGSTATTAAAGFAAGGVAVVAGAQTAYVCYAPNVDGATKDVQIATGQFNGSGVTEASTAITATGMLGETATGGLYALGSNGASIDVRVMTTAATTGWTTVLRVINTGSLPAPVTATYLLNDGTTGGSGTIIASLAAGATAMISSAQVETALGVTLPVSGNPPRIRISAPTDSLRVQAWIQTPDGAWFMGTPGQEAEASTWPNSTTFQSTGQAK